MSAALPSAQKLAAALPPLLLQAEQIAQTVQQGLHGRRRAGLGETFWQFRRYEPGDQVERIDWRQSSRTDKVFIREREYEAAQNACLWADHSASMHYTSEKWLPTKAQRAQILLLALASLLLRGGEKVTWIDRDSLTVSGIHGLEQIVGRIERNYSLPIVREEGERPGDPSEYQSESQRMAPSPNPSREGRGIPTPNLPPDMGISRHAHMVLASDFLIPIEDLHKKMALYAEQNLRGVMLHILDPIENDFKLQGRLRIQGCEGEAPILLPHAAALRDAYRIRMNEHKKQLALAAQKAGWHYTAHVTSELPHLALLRLYDFLDARA